MGHVAELLPVFDSVSGMAVHADEVEFAIWLHDCVYVAGRDDNESRSADVAVAFLRATGAATGVRERVRGMILATRHAGPVSEPDERLVADIDLTRLAVPAAQFEENGQRIREEYSCTIEEFMAGRRAFIESFLARPAIYQTDHFRREYEARARENLSRALARLQEKVVE